ncbi:MAG TPA: HD domain-containing protein [Pyrinomonadaceae bacterium]|jgi:guanosine-3',5'-bis(diphosphate) 3'-pyrophosphohydrolase
MEQENLAKLLAAFKFAADKHRDQRRKGAHQPPYINHLIEVTEQLVRVGKIEDINILVAAVLHDTVEDTKTTKEEIAEKFGERVSEIVMEVTDDKNLPKAERKEKQVEHAPNLSTEAKQIKLSDKTSNIREIAVDSPADWSKGRKLEYLAWGERVVNAGLRGVNADLEKLFDETVAESRRKIEAEN